MSESEISDLWNRTKQIYMTTLNDEQERSVAAQYFSTVSKISFENSIFKITASNKFASEFLKKEYSEKISLYLKLAGLQNLSSLEFDYETVPSHSIIIPPSQSPAGKTDDSLSSRPDFQVKNPSRFISTLPLDPNFTFEEFVQGSSNSWAYSSAKGVANMPGQKKSNPLFIHGGTGLGKTHLMQAIGNELISKNPSLSVCYITSEIFLNEYVNALQKKGIDAFRERYRNLDVLLIDDIQFLQKGKNSQEEFFNTFNFLTTNNKQIVMTSDVAPKNLPALEERLISRFEGGLVQAIEAPDYETRLAILKKKAENLKPSIPTSTLEFLAEHIKSHVRAMEGALSKVHIAISSCPGRQLTNDALYMILKDQIEKEQTLRKITIREIQESVARKFGISISQILSSDRTQSLVTPRQLAMYISRKYAPNSLQEIAKSFDKTHATIVHGVKTMENRLSSEPELKVSLEEILKDFGYSLSDRMELTM